ncbi:MAG: SDR family oxidoreductase [Thermoplasmata archaeon]|nr:SDR family oxidoreductase [Thermoplasmata archaeon]
MDGKVCMITGANSGIGYVTARELARMGADIVMVCRSKERGEAARNEIVSETGSDSVELMIADLSSQEEVRRLAGDFKGTHDRLHVLVNNAALWPTKRTLTVDGLELQFGLNHLAYFLLTNLLLDVLRASAPARVVDTSSGIHKRARIDFDDLQAERGYRHMRAYGQSKLANVLFTYELARRLTGTGVTVNSFTPGMTETNLGRYMSRGAQFIFRLLAKKTEKGATTAIYLASSPEVEGVSGKYFANCKPAESSKLSYDEDTAKRLWDVSESLTGLSG